MQRPEIKSSEVDYSPLLLLDLTLVRGVHVTVWPVAPHKKEKNSQPAGGHKHSYTHSDVMHNPSDAERGVSNAQAVTTPYKVQPYSTGPCEHCKMYLTSGGGWVSLRS